jgi:conflict system pore-forming effector with SLATT domain
MAEQTRTDQIETANIRPSEPGTLTWNSADPLGSLTAVAKYAENLATTASNWYWDNKRWKARFSRGIQLGAMTATALAGLVPVMASIFAIPGNTGLLSSALVGFAAALIGLDKAFGFSSGWARYVLTATSIRKALEEFRMDWTLLLAKMDTTPNAEQVGSLIQRAKDFIGQIEGLVFQETKDWVTEFQSNLAQIERDSKTQLDELKNQVQKTVAARAGAGSQH